MLSGRLEVDGLVGKVDGARYDVEKVEIHYTKRELTRSDFVVPEKQNTGQWSSASHSAGLGSHPC